MGRLIGVVFVGPLAYFAFRKKIPKSMIFPLTGLAFLIGAQGVLGWYMVKSGLEESIMDTPGAVPRVSQYRLAAHLGMAFLLYLSMFGSGMAVIKDWKYANGAFWSGNPTSFQKVLKKPQFSSFRRQSWVLTGLVLLTALSGMFVFCSYASADKLDSGAFVAGLDAGLLYNEFPLMGNHIVPPVEELFSDDYAKHPDKSDKWWRNIFENPTTVQFDHRVLVRFRLDAGK
jgi:cytochrome c oxidase assembly protein subunit 15